MSSPLPPRSNQPKAESANSPVSSDAEKDSYTLDEMMKALRDGERERESTSEVVTRSDGSVVHRVKRRKRRSDQPEKTKSERTTPEKKKKRFLWKLVICVSLFLFVVIGALFTIVGYNSKAYRGKVEERASSWTGAEVELKGLKLMPGNITMSGASFQWPKQSFLQDLSIRNLSGHANLTSFLWARLGGRELGGKVGLLNFQLPTENGIVGQDLEEPDFPFDFHGYYCDALDISFGKESLFSVKGTDSSFRYINGTGFRLSVDQGVLKLNGWDDLPINNGVFKFSKDQVNMETLILDEPGAGRGGISSAIKLSGMVPLAVGEKMQMDLSTSGFPMEHLFGKHMGTLISGPVGEASGTVDYTFGETSYDEVAIRFNAFQLQLRKFPFLINLDKMFSRELYAEVVFDNDIEGTFRANTRGVSIENLSLSQKDILILKGNIIISKSGRIGGQMRLSINNGLISSYPKVKSLPAFAGEDVKAYHTVVFELKGTMEEPDDTFRGVIGLVGSLETSEEGKLPSLDDTWKKMLESEKDE